MPLANIKVKFIEIKLISINHARKNLNCVLMKKTSTSIGIYSHCRRSSSHQLSATALLGSPDGSRYPLDVYEFAEEDYQHQPGHGHGRRRSVRGISIWECLRGCRQRLDQQVARKKVSLETQPTKQLQNVFMTELISFINAFISLFNLI